MQDRDLVRLHAVIDGRVQGVGFRYFVLETALPLDLTGWVRNTMDGQVEVVAEGQRSSLEQLLEALRRGPRAAYVLSLNQEWQTASGEFTRFDVRGTI
jgi:acylphosphatase